MPDGSAINLPIRFQPKQGLLLTSEATEILYGGAAGGGKSYAMRMLAILWAWAFPGLQVYLFRRISDDLVKNHVEGPTGFQSLLAAWQQAGFCEIVQGEIRFWNGSKIYLCHCHEDRDRFKYQGAEIHVLLIDELTHFSEIVYRFLRSRVRLSGLTLPAEIANRFPRIVAGSNPGNIGHSWVKRTFIDGHEPLECWRTPDSEGGLLRQYIPARLDDNEELLRSDPTYRARLRGLGSAALVKAMEEGDWNIIEGAFFDCWATERHVIRPFKMPEHWTRFRSFDWGSAKPFSVGWWAVVGEETTLEDGNTLPRGCLVRYREWYGCREGSENVGLKLQVADVAQGILMREEKDEKITYSVADPAIFKEDGGPSIGEQMARAGVLFRRADNARVAGWSQVRNRMMAEPESQIVCFSTCLDSIRTIPALMHDEHKPEDIDSDLEDHCFAAGTLVSTPQGAIPIEKLPARGVVHTRWGVRSYRSAGLIKADADLMRLTFSDGCVVDCTPDHRFFTEAGWKQAQELSGLWCIAQRFKNSTVDAITAAARTFNEKAHAFIALCGSTITARFLAASTFTMRTETAQTISLGTFDYLNLPRTYRDTCATSSELNPRAIMSSLRLQQPQRGIEVRPASNGIPSRASAMLSCGQRIAWHSCVNAAGRVIRLLGETLKSQNSVPTTASLVRCVSVVRLSGKHAVYCLTVPNDEEFLLASGLVVHNCGDEWRYACMSRPYQTKAPEAPADPFRLPTLGELTKRHIESCQTNSKRI